MAGLILPAVRTDYHLRLLTSPQLMNTVRSGRWISLDRFPWVLFFWGSRSSGGYAALRIAVNFWSLGLKKNHRRVCVSCYKVRSGGCA